MRGIVYWISACCLTISASGLAQGVRDRTRPDRPPETEVSESQAVDLTLTMVAASNTALQTWVRTAGSLDESGQTLTACVRGPDSGLVEPGQRVRAFPPDSKSSIYQARVSSVSEGKDCTIVEAALSGPTYERAPRYVMEIVVERGMYLAIPNEAIIEEGDEQIVYMEHSPGQYMPMAIETGLKGELYAQVVKGLSEGDRVVTFGSFFIDAEHKLRNSGSGGMPGMPGMSGMSAMPGMSNGSAESGMPGMPDTSAKPAMPGMSDTSAKADMADEDSNADGARDADHHN